MYTARRLRDGLKYKVSEEVYKSRMSETKLKSEGKTLLFVFIAFSVLFWIAAFING